MLKYYKQGLTKSPVTSHVYIFTNGSNPKCSFPENIIIIAVCATWETLRWNEHTVLHRVWPFLPDSCISLFTRYVRNHFAVSPFGRSVSCTNREHGLTVVTKQTYWMGKEASGSSVLQDGAEREAYERHLSGTERSAHLTSSGRAMLVLALRHLSTLCVWVRTTLKQQEPIPWLPFLLILSPCPSISGFGILSWMILLHMNKIPLSPTFLKPKHHAFWLHDDRWSTLLCPLQLPVVTTSTLPPGHVRRRCGLTLLEAFGVPRVSSRYKCGLFPGVLAELYLSLWEQFLGESVIVGWPAGHSVKGDCRYSNLSITSWPFLNLPLTNNPWDSGR